jgi:hypothetical protein
MTNFTLTAATHAFTYTGATQTEFDFKQIIELERQEARDAVAFSPINALEAGETNAQLTTAIRWHRDYRW